MRLSHIPGFSIDRVARAAGDDPDVLRLENLDTDVPPPPEAVEATRGVVGTDDANSYLPFTGQVGLREAVADKLERDGGHRYPPEHLVVTCGATEGMLDALLALTEPGDEVILQDPIYAGMIYRVRLAGAVPRLVPFRLQGGVWQWDLDVLGEAVGPRTRVVFVMNPSMPTGAVLSREAWDEVARLCREHDLWLLYNAAMERIVFDGGAVIHPLALDGMAERTVVVGSVSKEYRMIGWRTGWVAGPGRVMDDVGRVHIYNAVSPSGILQAGATAALRAGDAGVTEAVAEWERRRDVVLDALAGWPVRPCDGGWSLLLDVGELGLDSFAASRRLLEHGRVAATPMRDWGRHRADAHVRLVFSNEPADRLATLGDRLRRAF